MVESAVDYGGLGPEVLRVAVLACPLIEKDKNKAAKLTLSVLETGALIQELVLRMPTVLQKVSVWSDSLC